MTKNTPEKELEPFTASFLLQEFRKDMRHIDQKFDHVDNKIDQMGNRIDNNFKWLVGILLVGIALPFVKSSCMVGSLVQCIASKKFNIFIAFLTTQFFGFKLYF